MKRLIQVSILGLASLSGLAFAANTSVHKPVNTCSGTYPSYWQDIAPKFNGMWQGQDISNAPTGAYSGPVFKLSDDYPRQPVDDKANQPWRAAKFDAMFDPATSQDKKAQLAKEYAWLVYNYALSGNVNQPAQTDFDVCENPVRPWYHIAFQTYDPLSGREFIHGLTREAPVTFSIKSGTGTAATTMWAVAIYNSTAAYTLGKVWQKDGTAKVPTANIHFDEGSVIAKPLFNTATLDQLPVLANMPRWNANISDPSFCATPDNATMAEQSQLCPRNYAKWNDVKLMQFDISIADSRAKATGWVYGTFVADGRRKASVKDQWQRVSLLGLMWGNDTPPPGQLAYNYPKDPRKNGFKEEVIFWDVVDELNSFGGTGTVQRMGHLGSNHRLNGPADNANSSCISCHGTASVPDSTFTTPPLLAQFSGMTKQSVALVNGLKTQGLDRSGAVATENNGVTFSEMDAIYFANVMASTAFNMTTPSGKNVMGEGIPAYPNTAQKAWISLDYSLQLSMSLKQWMQWQADQAAQTPAQNRKFVKALRRAQ
ncbi:hypothetical protein [Undibacterium sp. Ji22W]|uniref:hypothetical protein n=1 Tax=Undibacterium sp. Ji22W TaxID=3413038 RepID=UPI003BF3F7B4